MTVSAIASALVLTISLGFGVPSPARGAEPAVEAAHSAERTTDATADRLFKSWNQALESGDPTRVDRLYTADAVLLPTIAAGVYDDRAERRGYFTHFLEKHPHGVVTERTARRLGAHTLISTGLYTFTMGSSGDVVPARFTFVYQQLHGTWLIVSHHSSKVPS